MNRSCYKTTTIINNSNTCTVVLFTILPLHLGYLSGIEVIDHNSTYTGKAHSYEWSKYGFKMYFPENAVPPGVDECRVHLKAGLSGQFDLPRDAELVSGVYWLSSCHVLTRPVTVEIQHCAQEDLLHQSRLTYIVASCSQEEPPYQFKILEGGVFSPNSRYGSINVTHISGLLAIAAQPLPLLSLMQRLSHKVHHTHCKTYRSRLYYSSNSVHSWEVHFVIMWNLELHITVSNTAEVHWILFVGIPPRPGLYTLCL